MLAGGPFRLALELRSAMKQEMPATGCLEGTSRQVRAMRDVGRSARGGSLGSPESRAVATGNSYKTGLTCGLP